MVSRRNPPPEPQKPSHSREQLKRCIQRLQKRIAELEDFDPNTVTKRFNDPDVQALQAGIEEALTEAFGHNTPDYRRYARATRLDHGPVVMSGSVDLISARMGYSEYVPNEAAEAREYLAEGKAESLALLKRALAFLNEELGDEQDDVASSGPALRYSVQRICLNGHQRAVDTTQAGPEPYCSACGEKTITTCQYCSEYLRGQLLSITNAGSRPARVPNFCLKCGKPFPWTERKFEAAIALLDEADQANDTDRASLRGALIAISADTPQTDVGVVRIKKLIGRVGKPIGDAIYKIAIDLATEAAKKSLFGS